jgi:ion channel-forming bestrophin family protein
MHTGRHYSLKEASTWTRHETAIFFLLATVPTVLYETFRWKWLMMSWLPIAIIGTAVAFITGFKNNASYSRLWEARQVWGSIVNNSRAWGIMVLDFLTEPPESSPASEAELRAARARLIHRHIAWLTALRYQLREPRSWENMKQRENVEYRHTYRVPEWEDNLDEEMARLLEPEDCRALQGKKNRATHIIALQSRDLSTLAEKGFLSELLHIEMARMLTAFYDAQGRSERIKNFPYPRQFATLNVFFVWLFILLVPLGLLQEFAKMGGAAIWMTIPISVIVSWVFHTMDKIGGISENPFEGSPNDVPISSLSRTIEIDLREMLQEQNIPEPITPVNNILM